MQLVNIWGPAILVCLTVVVGIVYQNRRIDDLRNSLGNRIGDLRDSLGKRIDDLDSHVNQRLDDLRELLKSEIARLEKRIECLESPLVRY